MLTRVVTLLSLTVTVIVVSSCGQSAPSPRQRVLDFVRLIQSDTIPAIAPFLDLDSVATYEFQDPKYDSLSLDQKKRRLLDGFTLDGEYRGTWAKSQIVVNEEFIRDDTTASVEVSFIDRATRIQYYSQMGLKRRGTVWVITNFKVN